ncbi:unnamed protein product [Arctia plantaginis]|uniref:Protein ELYS n=1 Tax=Arctia plantaginis TaxID=874455 RepID=A0A8S1BHY5_ARCPL|nr:unnamed protein product [Arctia plantaginis]
MQKLQDSIFSIVKTTSLSPAVFSFLQPTEDFTDKTPLGGILKDTKHGWLALGPKFCVVDLRTGLKVAARTFGTPLSNGNTSVTSVVELPEPLTTNSIQLMISLQNDECGTICVLHVNGSQLLRCIQTDVVVTELAICDRIPDGPFTCFDGVVMAGTKSGEIFAFDLNRACLIQALKDISQGYEHLIQNESNPANLSFLQYKALHRIEGQRELALENDNHIAFLLNENSIVDGQYIFRNPDGTVRMKAKRDHIRVTVLQYIPQLGSLAVGYNFGAFQIWNIMTMELEFTSQVNVECLPVTHFGFQEPCDDPRAFCYLWVIFSIIDRFEEEEFPLAVMYSLTYQGKRMLSDTKCLYQDFSSATLRFQLELGTVDNVALFGGKCVSCHTYSVNSTLAAEGEESMLNICQIVWECWGEGVNSPTQYGMLLFDLDQWYKDQMPATWRLESNAFMSMTWCSELSAGPCVTLDVRLDPASVAVYSHATRLEEHFYPNSLQYNCICLNTSESYMLSTIGIQRQIISSIDEVGPTALLSPLRLYNACVAAGLTPLYMDTYQRTVSPEEQRRFLLSVALEARLSRFLKRCAHDWATGSHSGAGCTLTFLVDWCWKRAVELKENATELTAPLFASSTLPDRNVVRCLEHCVQQLTQLTGLLDAVLTKCCNLIVPDALSEIEEKFKGIGTVSLYLQVVQWFLRVGLLPERHDSNNALPYPAQQLNNIYNKRRLKLNRLQDNAPTKEEDANKPCSLLYIDQLIEQEFGGDRIRELWIKGGSECKGLYPPPSLYSLLRLYLLCDIAEEHKHSLVLYLLVDYSMVYDEIRYEAVIRRLMQFPTMFGLSNTAIKATQAFWHLDHRDFDFALDQLQCLTGNTLSEWQHNVVLSTLLAQKKTQAALQYLHVRKPAPLLAARPKPGEPALSSLRVNDYDKLEDWQPCCNLYLARGLVFEALDVIRICVQNTANVEDKTQLLNFFYKGCRNTGNLAKILQATLLPFEEEVFIKYLEDCNDPNTSDILVMYYLQNSRYLEAERYNNKLKHGKPRGAEVCKSYESLFDMADRDNARDALVDVVCGALPAITCAVASRAAHLRDVPHVIMPRPMSVYVKPISPKKTFTYKSSFIQDTIENASETWINKPKMRRGIKRALNIEETPFICTPKLNRTRSMLSRSQQSCGESSPPKRARLEARGAARGGAPALSAALAALLDVPDVHAPPYPHRQGAGTPHSILKIRRAEASERDAASPVDSRYLNDSEDELLETASNHTHYSDSANKQLRFTIPTPTELGPSPSPTSPVRVATSVQERERFASIEKEMDMSTDSFVTTASHPMTESHPLESPPKKLATEETVASRKVLKDNVRARRSLSVSMNSSLSDDPNTSVESIADIPVTLINPRYTGDKLRQTTEESPSVAELKDTTVTSVKETSIEVPKTPKGRRSIRVTGESTPLVTKSRPGTPERLDSPVLRNMGSTRSRSRTPELSPRQSPLAPIPEQPKQEVESEPHPAKTTMSVPRQLRSRSRTPERIDKALIESPKLEVISESPTKAFSPDSSPSPSSRRSLRSRSCTPEVEIVQEPVKSSPRSLRSRSKTPEKLIASKVENSARGKKSLSRLVLEANTFAKTKQVDKMETDTANSEEVSIECTPMKALKPVPSLMDVTLSPIVNKSVLQSSTDSTISENIEKDLKSDKSTVELDFKPLPVFTTSQETRIEKSVLHSVESSVTETSETYKSVQKEKIVYKESSALQTLPAFSLNETEFNRSVLHSYESSVAETSSMQEEQDKREENLSKPFAAFVHTIQSDYDKSVLQSDQSSIAETSKVGSKIQDCSSLITNDSDLDIQQEKKDELSTSAAVIRKEKEKIVEIEREIHEIEGDMSDEENAASETSEDEEIDDESGEESESSGQVSSPSIENEEKEEIISILDTDESNSSSGRLEIDEHSSETKDSKANDETAERERPMEIVEQQPSITDVIQTENIPQPFVESAADPSNQPNYSLLTDDNSGIESDKSDINLNYSDGSDKVNAGTENQEQPKEIQEEPQEQESENAMEVEVPTEPRDEKTTSPVEEKVGSGEKNNIVTTHTLPTEVPKQDDITSLPPATNQGSEVTSYETVDGEIKGIEETKVHSQVTENLEEKLTEASKTIPEEKPIAVSDKEQIIPESSTKDAMQEGSEKEETVHDKETLKPARSRKRVKSTSSNKSVEPEIEIQIETPINRKRTQSNASAKSIDLEQTTPENDKTIEVGTPRRRAKTPTSAEVRKIITRRVSREMSEKDDSKLLDESKEELLTPRRRSTRTRSKNIDDNESVASESSVVSNKSRLSEDDKQSRKGKKTVLSSKPELSVIPEVISEEKVDTSQAVNEYSTSRRLTRNQKSMLESCMEAPPTPRRRTSTASRTSRTSRTSRAAASSDDDDSDVTPAFDVQPMDRMSLLNKTDFEGSPDVDELQTDLSPESLASDASKQRRSHLARAASEGRSTPKAAKINRRVSIDIAGSPSSPATRGRRASFTRACEALHTPKGRRTSTDVNKPSGSSPAESPAASEAEGAHSPRTPARRTRRASSTASNASGPKSDTGKRSKKTSLDESKDTKKK